MKKINFAFIFISILGLGLLTWTTYQAISTPTQYENLFAQDKRLLESNYNQIKNDEAIFDKYCKIQASSSSNSIKIKILSKNTKTQISNMQAFLTTPYTNEHNQVLNISFNKSTNEYTLSAKELNLGKSRWRVELKMDVVINNNELKNKKLLVYKQININN